VIEKWTEAFMTSSKSRRRALALALVVAWSSACGDETRPVEVDSAPPLEEIVACELSSSEQVQGLCEVGRVVDGDTLVIDLFGTEVKVRLAEIDAPESRQEYGSEATALLESFVVGENFELVNLGPDRYGRVLAHLHGERGCVNQRLVEQGAAWHYEDYSDSAVMAALQDDAKTAGLGLWGREGVVAPWDFRRGGSGAKSTVTKKRELSEVVSWTGSGSKYHKESCRYLSRAKVVNTGASPPSALTPCSVCFGRGD
jgi:endonuclease YncB( thermonuclease family)